MALKSLTHLARHSTTHLDQIEQVLFLRVEVTKRLGEMVVHETSAICLVGQRVASAPRTRDAKPSGRRKRDVVTNYRSLGILDAHVGGVASVVLPGGAEEVPVFATATSPAVKNEAGLDSASVTSAAPDGALQIVIVLTFRSPAGLTAVEHRLDAGEKFS